MKRGRKGKYKIYNNKVIVPNWNAGIYIRLSAEDRNDKDESNSITNQRELLNDFCNIIQIFKYMIFMQMMAILEQILIDQIFKDF